MKKILIVDDHEILLDSLSLLINSIEGMTVVGTLSDSRLVVQYLTSNEVDVIVTDLNMPYLNGIDLTFKILQDFPKVKILMLTVDDTIENIKAAFQAGISGYITKRASRAELEKAINKIGSGEKFFGEEVLQELLYTSNSINNEAFLSDETKALTSRELEVVRLIAQELSSGEIAERLFISVGTVENHRHNILQKLGVKNSIGVIKFALKYNLI